MVTYISSWARQVIVSVVVAIILEMILSPDSKSTKYIKTVIGIYVVYAIIAPGLNLINGKSLDFANINYENYFTSSEIYKNLESSVEKIENDTFEETYKLNLKQDIENKLREKGFIVSNIKLEVDLEENSEKYGEIKGIEISLSKNGENKNQNNVNENKVNEISVNKINIGAQGTTSSQKKGNLTVEEEIMIREFIIEEYGIEKNNISIR